MRRLIPVLVLAGMLFAGAAAKACAEGDSGAALGVDSGYVFWTDGALKHFHTLALGLRGGYFWKGKFEVQGGFRHFQRRRNLDVDYFATMLALYPDLYEIKPTKLALESWDLWLSGTWHFLLRKRFSLYGSLGPLCRVWESQATLEFVDILNHIEERKTNGTEWGVQAGLGIAFALDSGFSGLFEVQYHGIPRKFDWGLAGEYGQSGFMPNFSIRYSF